MGYEVWGMGSKVKGEGNRQFGCKLPIGVIGVLSNLDSGYRGKLIA